MCNVEATSGQGGKREPSHDYKVSADDEEARKAASILWLLTKWNYGFDCRSALCHLSPALPGSQTQTITFLPHKTHVARRMQPLLLAALAVNFNGIHPADACP